MQKVKRISMWTGPRNISTAMMYSWGSRKDTIVWDEPFYGYYLTKVSHAYTEHPGADEVIEKTETNWHKIVQKILKMELPSEKSVFFQKQMTHHILEEIDRTWMNRVDHFFLIRDPKEVLLSISEKVKNITLEDIGIKQEYELFEYIRKQNGKTPPVVESCDILKDTEKSLSSLCRSLAIGFDESMLGWDKGPKAYDGVWAKYWYEKVWSSNQFREYKPREGKLNKALRKVYKEAKKYYDELCEYKI